MDKKDIKYLSKNTNVERIEQINIVSKYISSSYGRSEFSYFVPSKYKYPQYKNNDDKVLTVVLDYNKLVISSESSSSTFTAPTYHSNIREYLDLIHNLLSDIPKDSFISFIFNGILGRSIILGLVDVFLNQKGCKGLLLQPYSLDMCIGLGLQHCILIDEYSTHANIYIVDDYVLHDCFTVKKTGCPEFPISVCLLDDQDYVEDYQKLRLTEDIPYYGCKVCDYKSKELLKIREHLKANHFFQERDNNMYFKYQNNHEDVIQEITNRLRFLYFNLDRLKRMNIRVVYKNCNEDGENNINISDLCDQLKFLYNNVITIPSDESIVYKGNELFNSLDLSKECWITDKEWNAGRLRILKDKILFNI